jgi:hypothetical protein
LQFIQEMQIGPLRHDLGQVPESRGFASTGRPGDHSRAKDSTPYEVGHDERSPLSRIFEMAELASNLKANALPKLKSA